MMYVLVKYAGSAWSGLTTPNPYWVLNHSALGCQCVACVGNFIHSKLEADDAHQPFQHVLGR